MIAVRSALARPRFALVGATALAATLLTGCFATSGPGSVATTSASPTSTVPSPTGSPDDALRDGLAALTDRLDDGWTAVGNYHLDADSPVTFQVEMSTDVRAGRMTYEGGTSYFYATATQIWVNALGLGGWRYLAPDLTEAQRDTLDTHWLLVPAGVLANRLSSLDGLLAGFADFGANARWTDPVDLEGTPCWTVTTDSGEIQLPIDDPYLRFADLDGARISVTMGTGVPAAPYRPTADDTVPWPG